MKLLRLCLLLLALLPLPASAQYVSGIDDKDDGKLLPDDRTKLHTAFLTYYKVPTKQKVNTILDLLHETPLLERKMAWPPMIGFLTVVFADNKDKVMSWISRHDYNSYAGYVIVSSLMHAKLRESALLFAKANGWSGDDLYRVQNMSEGYDLKQISVVLPGHIDTLWGAFFASGDMLYVDKIINAMFMTKLPEGSDMAYNLPSEGDALQENRVLAATTLRDYAKTDERVREAINDRIAREPNAEYVSVMKELLPKP